MRTSRTVSRHRLRLGALALGLALPLAACTPAAPSATQTPDQPQPTGQPTAGEPTGTPAASPVSFEGETIRLVVGYDPGGSYDDAARSLQPYLEEVTGATVVIENMPGAGNLIALNHVSQSAPDGTTIGTYNGPGNTVTVLTDTASESIQFDLAELSWLVGLTSEPRLMSVAADSPYQTFQDVLEADEEILLGVTGSSGAGYNDAVFFQNVFGDQVESRIVSGFESGAELQLAVIAGEVDINFQLLGGELPAIEAGEIRGLAVLAEERSDKLPDVPAITEFEMSDDARRMLEVHTTIAQLGIILTGPPDMPAEVLEAMRSALFEAASDPELVAEQQERGIAWNPRTGEEIEAAVLDALEAPQEYVDMMRSAIGQ